MNQPASAVSSDKDLQRRILSVAMVAVIGGAGSFGGTVMSDSAVLEKLEAIERKVDAIEHSERATSEKVLRLEVEAQGLKELERRMHELEVAVAVLVARGRR